MTAVVILAALLIPARPLDIPGYQPDGATAAYPAPGLYITVYDPALGGINCNDDCGYTSFVATGSDLYGWTAACPVDWLGHPRLIPNTTTVVTIWGQEYWCIDALGDAHNQRLTQVNGRPVYRIDIMSSPAAEHPWNNEYTPPGSWSRQWRPWSEFDALRSAAAQVGPRLLD